MNLKVSELFYSIQGEGRFMGVPSIFLRTFGCNFQCAGFGMPRGKLSTERLDIDPDCYQSYNELPLVTTGCDSYASWDARFKHLSPVMSIDKIVEKVLSLLPNHKWEGQHLVITGGEPLLSGWQKGFVELLQHPLMDGLRSVTFETNGTQMLTEPLLEHILRDFHRSYTFSVSPKLANSGETDGVRPKVVDQYCQSRFSLDFSNVYLKFVVANESDVDDVKAALKLYREAGFQGNVYLMPVGGVESVYHLNNRRVAELALENGMYYSDRLQVPLFKNAWAT